MKKKRPFLENEEGGGRILFAHSSFLFVTSNGKTDD